MDCAAACSYRDGACFCTASTLDKSGGWRWTKPAGGRPLDWLGRWSIGNKTLAIAHNIVLCIAYAATELYRFRVGRPDLKIDFGAASFKQQRFYVAHQC